MENVNAYNLKDARKITLEDWEQTGEGGESVCYFHKTDNTLMLKVHNLQATINNALAEVTLTRLFEQTGIPCAKVYELVNVDDKPGIIFERIPNKISLSRIIADDPSKLEDACKTLAHMTKRVHETPADTKNLGCVTKRITTVKERVEPLGIFTPNQLQLLTNLAEEPQPETCLVGDLHTGNVLVSGGLDGNPYWIDLGDFSWGNPKHDLARFYALANGLMPAPLVEQLFHYDADTFKKVWDAFIRAYLGTSNESDIKAFEQELTPYTAYVVFGFALYLEDKSQCSALVTKFLGV